MKYLYLQLIALGLCAAVASIDLVQPLICLEELGLRIVNGAPALPKQIPHQVGLILYIGEDTYWCGGSLLSNIYVLTAGHCAKDASKIIVILGANDIDNPNEVGQLRITVYASGITVHEDYDDSTLENDIAIIEFPEPIVYNDYIKNIKLPKLVGPHLNYAGKMARISGWGKTSSLASGITNKLRYADVCVQPNFICDIQYLGGVTASNICTHSILLKATCNGDSGGPLAYFVDDHYELIGIVSFGFSLGCDLGWSSGFTRVTSFLPWIYLKTGIAYL
ncbi:brachyurin-like [Lucilia sericata]|uniref:brachyurin-like n=1 Tax=Lucilia sericata TaxID=13632 RepID=UPI0018A7EF7D|nr:brachyurin-like [Lucilia sericata]